MRLPRDISSQELIKLLKKLGYEVIPQKGNHIRLTTHVQGEYYIIIKNHNPLRLGTCQLSSSKLLCISKKQKKK